MMAPILNTIGLVLTILGVLGLFRFGMPFHVPTKGVMTLSLSQTSDEDIARERAFGRLAMLSLALVITGTGFQIWATWVPA